MMKDTWGSVFGAHGPLPRIRADIGDGEREYEFAFDVPLVLAQNEQLCLEWGRCELAEVLKQYPERDIPGKLDSACALEQHRIFTEKYRAGEFRPPEPEIMDGKPTGRLLGGKEYERWMTTKDGKLGMILASLRVKMPQATMNTIIRLMLVVPDEMKALLDTLGKVTGEWAKRIARASDHPTPEAVVTVQSQTVSPPRTAPEG